MGEILRYKDFLKTYKTRSHRIRHLKDYRYLFPIKGNQILAGIITDLICDGNLQGDPQWRMDYTSKSLIELRRFEKEIKSLFKVKGRIRKCTSNKYSNTYNLAINCSPVARILFLCGVPAGQKVLTPFNVPKWIKNKKNYFKRFCQRLFSCEGGVLNEPNRRPRIRVELWKCEDLLKNGKRFLDEISKYLYLYFKIESTVIIQNKMNLRKDKIITRPVRLSIPVESTLKFYKEIGFEGKKQKTLKALLSK